MFGIVDDDELFVNDVCVVLMECDDVVMFLCVVFVVCVFVVMVNVLVVVDDVVGLVSELEDEDGVMVKLERASASAASAAEMFWMFVSEDGVCVWVMIGECG